MHMSRHGERANKDGIVGNVIGNWVSNSNVSPPLILTDLTRYPELIYMWYMFCTDFQHETSSLH